MHRIAGAWRWSTSGELTERPLHSRFRLPSAILIHEPHVRITERDARIGVEHSQLNGKLVWFHDVVGREQLVVATSGEREALVGAGDETAVLLVEETHRIRPVLLNPFFDDLCRVVR